MDTEDEEEEKFISRAPTKRKSAETKSERLTGELVKRSGTGETKFVPDVKDEGEEESIFSTPIKRQSTDTKHRKGPQQNLARTAHKTYVAHRTHAAHKTHVPHRLNTAHRSHVAHRTHTAHMTHTACETHTAHRTCTPMDTQSTPSSLVSRREGLAYEDMIMGIHPAYSLECIKFFLRSTKGQKIQVKDNFPDLQLFHDHVKLYRKTERYGEPIFSDWETYRLQKMLVKIRSQLESAD